MVDILATTDGALPPSADDSTLQVAASPRQMQPRRQRIALLREAIEAGEYRISAADLADSLLRVTRQAN